ncbi:hypothetical protein PMAYCL1PPCAC_20316, partial [Pristionchus mayeri]
MKSLGIYPVRISSPPRAESGIFVAAVVKGGAVDLDGRISPGDKIVQVNEVALDNLTIEQAFEVIRGRPIKSFPIRQLEVFKESVHKFIDQTHFHFSDDKDTLALSDAEKMIQLCHHIGRKVYIEISTTEEPFRIIIGEYIINIFDS